MDAFRIFDAPDQTANDGNQCKSNAFVVVHKCSPIFRRHWHFSGQNDPVGSPFSFLLKMKKKMALNFEIKTQLIAL